MTDPQSGWGTPGYRPPASPAPKPGVIPLRPLGLGEILDGAISYIRANPTVTLGLSAVVMTLTQLVQLPASYLYFDGLAELDQAAPGSGSEVAGALGGGLAATLLGVVVNFVAVTLLTGMLIVVLSRAVLGWRTTLQEAWAAARPRLPGLLGLSLLTALLLAAALVAGIVPIVLAAVAGAPVWVPVVLGAVTVPAAICLMIYLWVALALAPPGYMLEHIGVLAALSRSRRLVGPRWWRVFGILLLGTLIGAVISGIINIPFAVAAAAIDGAFTADAAVLAPTSLTALLIAAVGTIIAGTITAPFTAGVTGLLYFDQRIRREAWDLELARAVSGGPPTAAGPSLEPAW
ncbi:MAG: hypothetical protein ACRDSL_04210 [Pseudonocardiaceae bacterium]